MRKYFCDLCGTEIPEDVIARRHNTEKRNHIHFCNRDCAVEYRKQQGQYKEMSTKGREKRSKSVSQSNKEHPRRKHRDAPIFA